MIVVWTAESVRSKYVRMEAGIALGWGKRLIPVRQVDLPKSEIPAPFDDYQTLDVTDLEAICRALEQAGVKPERPGRRKSVSLEEFMSELGQENPSLAASVNGWLQKCSEEGFRIVVKRSLMVKSAIPKFGEVNFGTLFSDGTVQTNYISESSRKLGDPSVAADYLDGVAKLIDGAAVWRGGTEWNWRVEVGGQLPKISSLLARGDEWLNLMKVARARFSKVAATRATDL